MKSLLSKLFILTVILSIISPSVSAHSERYWSRNSRNYHTRQTQAPEYRHNYQQQPQYYTNPPVVSCSNLSNVSVGIGNLSNGVNISVASNDYTLQNCIKNTSWLPYFIWYGNNVTVSISNTTLGVQILATSSDTSTISNLQNAGWVNIITGISSYNYNYNYNYNHNDNYQYVPNPTYTNTDNRYRRGTYVFGNTSQIVRSLYNISNGVQMNFTSPDYTTMLFLQRFSFTSIFSYLSGISISQSNVSWGTQVTVTAGSTSTIQEIQNIGYALVYQ